MDTACGSDVRVLGELGPPAVLNVVLAERAGLAREGRRKAPAVVLELVGVARVGGNVVAEGAGSIRRVARQNATNRWFRQVCGKSASRKAYLISNEMNSLKPVPDC